MKRTLLKDIVGANGLYVGIDLGRDTNVAVICDGDGQRVQRFQFKHSRESYDRLHEQLRRVQQQREASGIIIGMEPTAHHWKWLACELEARQIPYRLVNAYTVKRCREGMQLDRAKDDRRDAAMIAELLRTSRVTETQRLRGVAAELRQYSWQHTWISKELRRQKTILHQLVDQLFPEIWQVFSTASGQTAQAMLKRHAAAATVRTMAWEQFVAAVRADYTGKRLQVAKLRQLHQLAHVSLGLPESAALQASVAYHLDTLLRLQASRAEAAERLLACFLKLPTVEYLLSLGLGQVTTAHIVAELGDFDRFRNAGQLVKMAGIQPSPNSSGRRHGASRIARKGRPGLRRILFLSALRLIQTDTAFAAYYHQLQQRQHNPLCKMQAIVVLMHKTLRILWALHRKRQFYDPTAWGTPA